MRKSNIFEKFKLNSKLTPITIALIFIPIAIFSGVLFSNIEITTIRENREYMEAKIERDYGVIETNIESVNMSTRFFLSDEELMNMLNIAYDGVELNAGELRNFYDSKIADLERLVNNNPFLYAVRVYSVTDNVQEMMPILYTGSRMKNLAWYGDDMEGWHFGYYDTLFSSLISKQGDTLSSYVTAVNDYDRGTVGYIEAVMTMETMFPEVYADTAKEWSFFTDIEGNVLFGSGEEAEQIKVLKAFENRSDLSKKVIYKKINGKYYIIAGYPVRLMNGTMYCVKDISDELKGVYAKRNLFVLIMLVVLVVAIVLIDRMIRKYQKEVLDKNAELRSLHNQINAHFIHNVLESIKMMAEIDEKYEISDAITSLGKLMRYGIRRNFESVPLKDELEYIENYIKLMNLRYDFEVILSVNVPDELMDQEILKMSLQPVVENALVHGIEPSASDTTVYIKARESEKDFTIEITDSGEGMNADELEKLKKHIHGEIDKTGGDGSGIGLKNVEDRIKLTYGNEYGMEIYSEEGKYTKISMVLPRKALRRKNISDANLTDSGR